MTWLGWCDEYLQCAIEKGDCKKMVQHKGVVRKRIAAYLKRANRTDILLKEVDRDMVSGLFRYMREYRNPRQIKSDGGKLADFTLVLFEETVKAIFNKAVREGLIPFNPIQNLAKEERFHVPDKHREYLTADELKRFLAVETRTQAERTVQKAFGFSCMTGLRLGDMQATVERHQGHGRGADGFHRPAKDRATRNRSTQRVSHIPVAAPTGERGGHYHLPIGEEARQRGEICAAHQGEGRDRKGFHLP